MTKKQIIQWCYGQHAAAYFMGKKKAPPRPVPSHTETVARVDTLSEAYIAQTFRLGFRYQSGRTHIHPNRLRAVRQAVTKNVRFTTSLIHYTELEGLVETFIMDDNGVILDRQSVNLDVRDTVIKCQGRIAIQFILNKRKINV